jgi:hypothetical protein
LTNQAVLDLCHQAYRSLKSYHGTTVVESLSEWPDGMVFPIPPELNEPPDEVRSVSSAEIWYAAPNLLRIGGNLRRLVWEPEDDPYEIVCDGRATWCRWSCSDQAWEKEESVSMAIAGFTGVSGGACHTIPSLLLGEDLGWACKCPDLEAKDVEEAGRPAWRVDIPTDIGEVNYGVDKASGLLLSTHSFTDTVLVREETAKLRLRMADRGIEMKDNWALTDEEDLEGPIATDTTEVYEITGTNADLPASLFARPEGAPE